MEFLYYTFETLIRHIVDACAWMPIECVGKNILIQVVVAGTYANAAITDGFMRKLG